MGLITGAVSCMRFNVVTLPENLRFDLVPFRPILPGSNLREREGIIPFEPEEPYDIGTKRWAFRVRMDKVQLDSTLVSERLKELVKTETEQVGPPSPKTRRKLRQLAEDEMMEHPMPRSKIVECVLEETMLHLGTTAKGHIGTVLELLKKIGVEVEYKTPWLDAGHEEDPSELIDIKEPGQSVLGCRFLKKLLNDADAFLEPENGSVKLVTVEGAKVNLSGPVLNEIDRFLEQGAELLSARLLVEGFNFNLDALSYRINGLRLESYRNKHWTEQLDIRMEKINQLWQWLDQKYHDLMVLTAE